MQWVEKWGAPDGNLSSIVKPPGAEIKVSLEGRREEGWRELIHALSGLFCTSLQLATSTEVVSWNETSTGHHTTIAWLPGEAVCAENLTPWISLLPCRDQAGIAQILQETQPFYSGLYHSMSVSIELVPDCTMAVEGGSTICSSGTLHLRQKLSLVQQARGSESKLSPDARLSSLGSLLSPSELSPSLVDELEYIRCPVASSSRISLSKRRFPLPPWIPHQYLLGSGTLSGQMVIGLSRPKDIDSQIDLEVGSTVCIFQVIPWPVHVWLHTLKLEINNKAVTLQPGQVTFNRLQLSRYRESPLVLDLCLHLPVNTVHKAPARHMQLSWSFTKSFLAVSEQPPDAHRGLDVPSAVLRFPTSPPLRETRLDKTVGLYSEGLLVQLATADISMPYNVICLTGTVLAIFCGALLNSFMKRT
jgi:phosphatidylinositol glycan class T